MDWTGIMKEVLVTLIPVLIIAFAKVLHNILVALLNSIKNPTVKNLATQAVLWAEDKFGPDSAKGQIKLAEAVAYLSAKTGMSKEDAEVKIRAAYQEIFGNLGNAVLPSVPSAT